MKGLEITDVSVLSLPLKTRFRGIQQRELVIFRGKERYAEFSPFVEYDDHEASSWLKSALSFANQELPEIKRQWVGTNATLPAVGVGEIESVLQGFPNFRTVKIKVAEHSDSLSQDLERIRFVHKNYPGVKIRLDANGALSVSEAIGLLRELDEIELQYFEQPVKTISELRELRSLIAKDRLGTKIAADESIRKASDPLEVARLEAADIAVIKVQPLGGIENAKAIAAATGLEIVVSSALESSLGIAQGLYLAASLDQLDYDCGLWTQNLLAADVVATPLEVQDARIRVEVPEIDQQKLKQYRAAPERESFWLNRLERCYDLLQA